MERVSARVPVSLLTLDSTVRYVRNVDLWTVTFTGNVSNVSITTQGYVCLSAGLSFCQSFCQSLCRSVCRSVCRSDCLSAFLSVFMLG